MGSSDAVSGASAGVSVAAAVPPVLPPLRSSASLAFALSICSLVFGSSAKAWTLSVSFLTSGELTSSVSFCWKLDMPMTLPTRTLLLDPRPQLRPAARRDGA